jgi:hypothetical protein
MFVLCGNRTHDLLRNRRVSRPLRQSVVKKINADNKHTQQVVLSKYANVPQMIFLNLLILRDKVLLNIMDTVYIYVLLLFMTKDKTSLAWYRIITHLLFTSHHS